MVCKILSQPLFNPHSQFNNRRMRQFNIQHSKLKTQHSFPSILIPDDRKKIAFFVYISIKIITFASRKLWNNETASNFAPLRLSPKSLVQTLIRLRFHIVEASYLDDNSWGHFTLREDMIVHYPNPDFLTHISYLHFTFHISHLVFSKP